MRRVFHCGDGLRPELQVFFDGLEVDPCTELFVRLDGKIQSGPDPVSETAKGIPIQTAWTGRLCLICS